MTDTTKIAVDALQARAQELILERDEERRRLLLAAYRDWMCERAINGCLEGARALGAEIDVSGGISIPPHKQQFFNQFLQWRAQLGSIYPQLRMEFGIEDDSDDGADVADETRPEMPRIADIILERLQAAGNEGAKASDIRRFIFRTYKSDIHEKTVGMTLNRMQAAGQVRRDGRIWFLTHNKEVAT